MWWRRESPTSYVPDGFERPRLYKFAVSYMIATFRLARIGERIGIGHEASNHRQLSNFLDKRINDPKVNKRHATIAGVKCRVYMPVEATVLPASEEKRPVLVYFHGGGHAAGQFIFVHLDIGFAAKSLESCDEFLNGLVKSVNMIAVSVDYKLAPEHPYPAAIEESYALAKYLLSDAVIRELNGDPNKIMLGGDSSGGNIVAVITQRLAAEGAKQPCLQILIYPWVQLADNTLPSMVHYDISPHLHPSKFVSWYLGISDYSRVQDVFRTNSHMALIDDDDELRDKITSYLDVQRIPSEYRHGKTYYDDKQADKNQQQVLDVDHVLIRERDLADRVKQVFSADVSPLFAERSRLVGLPPAYILALEWDPLKDEYLLYAERLREVGVPVHLAFYENAFHGIASYTSIFRAAKQMQDDLVNFIRSKILST